MKSSILGDLDSMGSFKWIVFSIGGSLINQVRIFYYI